MLILKAHYFLWFGSLSGVLPYTAILGKEYTLATATEIGFLYTILPFVALLAKPLACSIADRFSAHKLVLVSCLILTLLGYGLLLISPWLTVASSSSWWFFCAAVLVANTSMGVVITLTDSLAMKEVSAGRSSYGSIRVFGTLGWGILGLVAGGINNDLKIFTGLPYLLPGLIMFVLVICIDILAIVIFLRETVPGSIAASAAPQQSSPGQDLRAGGVSVGRNQEDEQATHVWKDVVKSFISFPSLFYYGFVVFMCGLLTAFHWSFFFWFLESIQEKDTLLLGWCLVVQSFLGEVPFFLCSDWIVKKIGFDHSLSVTFLSIAVRYLSYGFLIKRGYAYYVLIVELTQGPSFGLFYVVMTAIAQSYSLKSAAMRPGTQTSRQILGQEDATLREDQGSSAIPGMGAKEEIVVPDVVLDNRHHSSPQVEQEEKTYATMQGIMSGLYEGAGLGVGAMIAGMCIDRFGSEFAWISAGFLSLAVCTSNLLLTLNLENCSPR